VDDAGAKTSKFEAPKTVLMQLIIDGILDRRLPWGLVLIGVLIAVTLELSGVPSLPFAVGVYLPLEASTPIFIGGLVRLAVDRWQGNRAGGEDDSGPAVLLSSGYIAGGAIAAVLISFMNFKKEILEAVDMQSFVPDGPLPGLLAFTVLAVILFAVGISKRKVAAGSQG
jgi:uncharacterized oligopeptide transporter (OPT) family protein